MRRFYEHTRSGGLVNQEALGSDASQSAAATPFRFPQSSWDFCANHEESYSTVLSAGRLGSPRSALCGVVPTDEKVRPIETRTFSVAASSGIPTHASSMASAPSHDPPRCTPKRAILVINPNMSQSMTDGLRPLITSLRFDDVSALEYDSAADIPAKIEGVPSINNEDDAAVSAAACLPTLLSQLDKYDGFLVCCYSHHPLVSQLRTEIDKIGGKQIVTGIFEASIATCLQSIEFTSRFGIVSTGQQWEDILGEAVTNLLGSSSSIRYAGTATTGLNAEELHTSSADEVRTRMMAATQDLLSKGAAAICLGCAGMAGMDAAVRQACIDFYGQSKGNMIKIVDGVVSGVVFLEGALRAGR
nr:uncharacterized protein c1f7.10 [Quercus suber]